MQRGTFLKHQEGQVTEMAQSGTPTAGNIEGKTSVSKVTLVKSAELSSENAARPKIGRPVHGVKIQHIPPENPALPFEEAGAPEPENMHSWSFQSVFICVVLFVLVNIAFMTLFNSGHSVQKSAEPAINQAVSAPPAPAITMQIPTTSALAGTAPPSAPASAAPVTAEASAQEKAANQATLLSILSKD